jgi:16S rRNA (guanine966-N2)-methyltransferase
MGTRSTRRTRAPKPTADGQRYELRIIGGEWRGRRLRFPVTRAGIRPTPDRVRETLFNWLQGRVAGRRCLDLFAGSGALGVESLSRGAREVVFVESDRDAARAIEITLAALGCDRGRVVATDAVAYLRGPAEPFDVVFLDPPFDGELLEPACRLLVDRGWLAADARVYLEQPADAGPPAMPAGWQLLRSKRAGEVGYHLAGPEATARA